MEQRIRSTMKRWSCYLSSSEQPHTWRKNNRTNEELLNADSWFKRRWNDDRRPRAVRPAQRDRRGRAADALGFGYLLSDALQEDRSSGRSNLAGSRGADQRTSRRWHKLSVHAEGTYSLQHAGTCI